MLGPGVPVPSLHFAKERMGQATLDGQVQPFRAPQDGSVASGLGLPTLGFGVAPMVRASRGFAVGLRVESAFAELAHYRNPDSAGLAPTTGSFGVSLAVHASLFDVDGFGLDLAGQASVHFLPLSIGLAPGPLGIPATGGLASGVTPVPGFLFAAVPRYSGRHGTVFVTGGAFSSPDIAARGLRVVEDGRVTSDDTGGPRHVFAQVGLGYAVTFDALVLGAQLQVPLGGAALGLLPSGQLTVGVLFGRTVEPTPGPSPRPPAAPAPRAPTPPPPPPL